MSIIKSVGETIRRYGSEVTIRQDGEAVCARAFVEPLRYRNQIYIGGQYHALGQRRRQKYLYIGSAAHPLRENACVIEAHGSRYVVRRSETYYVKEYPVYEWAILTPYGETREDEYEPETNETGA